MANFSSTVAWDLCIVGKGIGVASHFLVEPFSEEAGFSPQALWVTKGSHRTQDLPSSAECFTDRWEETECPFIFLHCSLVLNNSQ